MEKKSFFNWSGGKDSALCLYKAMQFKQHNIRCLLTSMNVSFNRVSMHGVRRDLLEAQVASIGIPLQTVELPEQPTMEEYEVIMKEKLLELKKSGFSEAIFGDIFLEDLKKYRERNLGEIGIECVFPLWKKDTKKLLEEFIGLGFKAIIVCVNEKSLDKSFCGRHIDLSLINDLPASVDAC